MTIIPPGTVGHLDGVFIKAYVEALAPYENATDIRPLSWFEMCENAYALCYPDRMQPEPAETIVVPIARPLSAIEYLASKQNPIPPVRPPGPAQREGRFARLWRWLAGGSAPV